MRRKLKISAGTIVATLMCVAPMVSHAQNFPSGEEVARQALRRAIIEKQRNDEIVRQQRQREQERREQERKVLDLEKAKRRANTG